MLRTVCSVALVMAGISAPAHASDPGSSAQFQGCTEFAGEQTVDLAKAQAHALNSCTLVQPTPGQAALIVRFARCDGVQINGGQSEPAIVNQIGLNIVPLDGTATIDVVSLLLATNDPSLATAFRRAGAPAELDQRLAYYYQQQDGSTNVLLFAAAPGDVPFFLFGKETAPQPSSQELFIANGWYGAHGAVKEATPVPQYLSAPAEVSLCTSADAPSGKLIGGDVIPFLTIFSLSGKLSVAELTVTKLGD